MPCTTLTVAVIKHIDLHEAKAGCRPACQQTKHLLSDDLKQRRRGLGWLFTAMSRLWAEESQGDLSSGWQAYPLE